MLYATLTLLTSVFPLVPSFILNFLSAIYPSVALLTYNTLVILGNFGSVTEWRDR